MFKWGRGESEQAATEAYQLSQQCLQTNQVIRREMGNNAPIIDLPVFRAYRTFLKEYGFYVQTLQIPDERGRPQEITRQEFFDLPEFAKIKDEDQRIITAIVYLFSLKEEYPDIWVTNDRRIREYAPKKIE